MMEHLPLKFSSFSLLELKEKLVNWQFSHQAKLMLNGSTSIQNLG